ncbi:MAG: histidine kinase [Sphingomonadaceae bacterium]|nr:histidine kinase [Sphingomonadaceae bacterium]MBJ7388128.1 histidine kinase [Sphingomonadaceae bacterium]
MERATSPQPLIGHQVALLTITGFWAFYVLVVTLRAALLDYNAQAILFERRLMVALAGVLVTWILYVGLRMADRRSLGFRVGCAFVGAIPCAVILASANFYIFYLYDPISLFKDPSIGRSVEDLKEKLGLSFWQEIADISITHYFFLIAWGAFYVAIGYAREVREAERKMSRFAQAAQDAELRSLRYQVNPHFLFNTLNSLSSLVLIGKPKEAEAMIQNLSNFYRTSLSSDPLEDVTLAEEVELQRLYLEIESVRYPKRLRVKIDIPDAVMGQHVPALILQPLVENAIKYGVSRTTRPVELTISAKSEGDVLILSVLDDGEAVDPDHVGGNGIGLANVRDRLEARYKSAARLDTQAIRGGGFVAMLTLPLNRRIAR